MISQETPAAACAGVGGQGNWAAWLLAPLELPFGGPITPVARSKLAAMLPVELVVTRSASGSVQPTGMVVPATVTVGWLLSALHSTRAPRESGWKPFPEMARTMPALRQVPGSTVRVAPPEDAETTDGVQGPTGTVVVVVVVGASVVVVVGATVVVVVGATVVVVVGATVVVVVGGGPFDSDAKLMGTGTSSPAWSP